MAKKYLIFDMDGTLLDSMGFWDRIAYDYLKGLGYNPPVSINETIRAMTTEECCEHFRAAYNLQYTDFEIMTGINEYMLENYRSRIMPKPYVIEFLELCKASGIPMCVATASDKKMAELAFGRLDMMKYFDFVINTLEVGKNKRYPDIYLRSAERLGGKIEECWVFEDALHCVQTAKQAGFNVVGIYDEVFASTEDEIRLSSDIFIKSYKELIDSGFAD